MEGARPQAQAPIERFVPIRFLFHMTQHFSHKLHFHKLQGAGNDFVVLDLFAQPLPADFRFDRAATLLCDRHLGVGGDGLLTLEPATDGSAARMKMWNPDGSEDMCGNGLRCVAWLASLQKIVRDPVFQIQTLVGARRIEILGNGLIRAEMGVPVFDPALVPITWQGPHALDIEIPVEFRAFPASSLSTGSTHTVIFLDQPLSVKDFLEIGPQIETHKFFPNRTSVMFAVADGSNRFKIRIWERGVGETWACGTGACAVAVAAQKTRRAQGPIQIESKGGILSVEWQPGEPIFLTGPARAVFEAATSLEI